LGWGGGGGGEVGGRW
jgi:hypothetical protein